MDVEAVVLIGAANPRREALEEGARSVTGARVLYDAPNVPELMAWADVALVAAGGTCLELAYMGLPSLAVVTAENQRRVAECLAELGTVRSLGEAATVTSPRIADEVCHLLANREERRTMAARGRALVDGLGARRVIDVLWEVSS
jgi:spore coat polysaccharide biosynthesis predicted glycosyltransferase SpsG